MNNVSLIGRLTRDPEVRYTDKQMAIATFTLAVNRPVVSGNEQKADFIRIKCFGKLGELVEKYLSKGRQVGIQGRIQTGSYEDKDGQKQYTTDVIADKIEFLGNKSDSRNDDVVREAEEHGFEALTDDIPF